MHHSGLVLLACAAQCCGATSRAPRCLVDSREHRQLSHQVCLATGPCASLTVEWCASQCRGLNYSLAGVEASHQCACGDVLATPTAIAPASDCNETCTGNATELCGGNLRVWVVDATSAPLPPPPPAPPASDPRFIPNGRVLRTGGYSCQPYCAVLPDGTWSCAMTYIHGGSYVEGAPGEHMVAMQSSDQGRTWTEFSAIEPYSNATTGQVSAYGSAFANQDGSRVFAVWVQNTRNVSHLPGAAPNPGGFRADMLGDFVWKYSDQQGRAGSWSDQHFKIPVQRGYIESVNSFAAAKEKGGDDYCDPTTNCTQIMWEVDHPKTLARHNGMVMFAFTKIGTYAVAPPEEMHVLASPNLLRTGKAGGPDPEDVEWRMFPDPSLPENDGHGVAAVGAKDSPSTVAEEPHVVPIANETVLYMVFRTSQGYMGTSQSLPGGPEQWAQAWAPSSFARFLPSWTDAFPNASWVKQPRGPQSPKRHAPSGLVLMTFYNTAPLGAFATHMDINDRTIMWLVAGHEVGGTLLWSQPELLLYERAENRSRGHGYADVITDVDGRVYITETFKAAPYSEAKTHPVEPALIANLTSQTKARRVAGGALALEPGVATLLPAGRALPDFTTYQQPRYGFTLDMWLAGAPAASSANGTAALFDAPAGSDSTGGASASSGVFATQFGNGTVELRLHDRHGREARWRTDPVCSARLATAAPEPAQRAQHHLGIVVDGGPKMISFVVDGKLCDGGPVLAAWPNGHMLFDPLLGDVGGGMGAAVTAGSGAAGVVVARLYPRVLYTSELVSNWRAGLVR